MDIDNCDINLSEYSEKDLKMHYKLCLTLLKHFETIMTENPVLSNQERTALTVCMTEAQADVDKANEEFKRRSVKSESD